ncbi:MAG: hypothetical protein KAW88_03970 [Candidatus Cloacimonetes bacterium]|nr:hypothetical protein [Candidatus Cloacimonadota bacterium]
MIRVASDLGKRYFFGLNYITAEEMYNISNSFIAFICGNINRIIFIPAEIIINLLPQISHDRNGEYKINITRELNIVLKGRNNQYDCSNLKNNWNILNTSHYVKSKSIDPIESLHTIMQGRLIDIGNIRGYDTYCPNKSKKFNNLRIDSLTSLQSCPQLQYTDYKSLRNIDVVWFRRTNSDHYPEYAFEVEFSTGVWSGFGRLSSLREYNTKLYIITHDDKKYKQVIKSFPEMKNRVSNITPDNISLLYSAEKNLIQMRNEFNL